MANAGRVLTRDVLIDRIWGPNYFGDTKTLDVHIKRLRSKLEADSARARRGSSRCAASATATSGAAVGASACAAPCAPFGRGSRVVTERGVERWRAVDGAVVGVGHGAGSDVPASRRGVRCSAGRVLGEPVEHLLRRRVSSRREPLAAGPRLELVRR